MKVEEAINAKQAALKREADNKEKEARRAETQRMAEDARVGLGK
jgi:hypothetical protein